MSSVELTDTDAAGGTGAPTPRSPRGGPLRFLPRTARLPSFVSGRLIGLIALNILFALVMATITPHFLTAENFKELLIENSMEFILAAFMAFLLIARMFDLSLDGVINMCGVIAGLLLVRHVPVVLVVIVALAAGAAVGLLNGVAVTKWHMNPLMTTLGTWWGTQGIAYGLTNGVSPNVFPSGFDNIGAGSLLNIAMPVWYLIVIGVFLIWLLRKTRFGYHVFAVGGDAEAARLRGVRVDRTVIATFVMMGLASAFAGVVYAGQLDAASPVATNGANLRVIAGAVIGGCSLRGGRGSVIGAVLGIFFLAMLNNAVVVLGINPYWQYTVLGVVVFGAVALDAAVARRSPARA
jgi:ribose transport system permease protein